MDKKTVIERATERSRCRASCLVAILFGMAILIGIPSTRWLRADGQTKSATATEKAANTTASAIRVLDLRIVGPDGQPIPEAMVNVSTQPAIDKVQLRKGTLLNKPRFGVNLRSNAEGQLVLELPPHLITLSFQIRKPQYGYYFKWWNLLNKPEALAAPVTAKLEKAWTIGGLVVDSDGKPIANARVLLQLKVAETGGSFYADRLWTNSKGIWKFENVPESMSSATAEVSEPKYRTANQNLSRTKFEIDAGHEPSEKITLKTGLTVTGKVTDENGKPIAKALVRTSVGNDVRTAFTDKKGAYQLEGCDLGDVRIVASAKRYAADFQDVEVGPHLGPVDFQLNPGRTVRVRVLDEQGHPASKATVVVQHWRGQYLQLERAPRETDVDGRWEWNEAPATEVMADIGRPEGMTLNNRPLRPRTEEYVFRVPAGLVISGKVLDAETKQPIKAFRLLTGYLLMGGQLFWSNTGNVVSNEGRYEVRQSYEQPAFVVRIEADGYLRAATREIKSDEGKVVVDFLLHKDKNVTAKVMTPDGFPAPGAKVALVLTGQRIRIHQGDLDAGSSAEQQETDANGRFRLTAKKDDFWLVVTHRSGYAELPGAPNCDPPVIKLNPWARIEGTYQVARRPQSDVAITIKSSTNVGQNSPIIAVDSQAQTDLRGRFALDRVMPGRQSVLAKRNDAEGEAPQITFSRSMNVDCPAGTTTHVDFGTTGRPVIGQIRQPADSTLDLSKALIYVSSEEFNVPGVAHMTFQTAPDREGNFTVEDVPPDDYMLYAYFPQRPGPRVQGRRFTVQAINERLSQRPVDLGVLTLMPDGQVFRAQKVNSR
jgi:Carboxypeptidase regulatory-like domain